MPETINCKTIEEASQILEGNIPAIREYLEWVCKDVNEKFNKKNFSDGIFNLSDLYISLKTIEKRRWDKYEAQMQESKALEIGSVEENKSSRVYEQMDHEKLSEYEREITIDADKAVRNHKSIVILGNPGEGKTTLLYHYVYTMANESLEKLEQHELPSNLDIPLFARLPQIGKDLPDKLEKDTSLIDVVMTVAEVPETLRTFTREQYGEGRVSLFLDALDEVSGEYLGPDGILQRYLSRDINECPVVITSRIVGYPGSVLKSAVKELKLVPFSQKEMVQYIKIRFKEDMGNGSELLRQLRLNPSMRGLTQNPLLLGMMCKLFDVSGESLPNRRVELYERCVNGLLVEWKQHRGLLPEDDPLGDITDRKKELLEQIAYHFTFDTTNGQYFKESFTGREIRELFKDQYNEEIKLLLKDIINNDGILVRIGARKENRYTFLHLTFQEYFAASALSRKEDWLDMIKGYFWKPRWQEVIKLLAGTLEDPMLLIDALCREEDLLFRHLFLATKCIAEIDQNVLDENKKEKINELVNKVYDIWDGKENDFVSDLAGDAMVLSMLKVVENKLIRLLLKWDKDMDVWRTIFILSEIGTQKVVHVLIQVLKSKQSEDVWSIAASALGDIGTPEVVQSLIQALKSDENEDVRKRSAEALGEIDTPEVVQPLIQALNSDEDGDVRKRSAEALGKIGDPKTVQPLIQALNSDEDVDVLDLAAEALGKIGTSEAVQALIQVLLKSDESYFLTSLIYLSTTSALGETRDPKAVQALIQILKSDENDLAWSGTAFALGKIGTPEAVQALIQALETGEDEFVRMSAAEALGEIDTPEVVQPLIQALNSDENGEVREHSAKALGKIDTPEVVQPLIQALNSDENGEVREHSAEALGKIGTPEVVQPLIQALESDENKDVRYRAAYALGEPIDPKAVQVFIQVLDSDKSDDVRKCVAHALHKISTRQGKPILDTDYTKQ